MRIVSTRRLRGPNRYLARPVAVARVLLDELTERETVEYPGFAERLLAALPGLADHHCAAGRPGGFVARLREGTYFGHVAEHIAIELSLRIGREVSFGRTEHAGGTGEYDVVTECPLDEPADSQVPEHLLTIAFDVVADVLAGRAELSGELTAALAEVRARYEREAPGPTTVAIAAAARARGIPVERVGELSLLRLGEGEKRRLVWAAMTDTTGAVGVDIAGDKQLTRQLLDDAGVPVPRGGPARTLEQALARFAELRASGPGARVVVKPRTGRQGRHVYLGLDSPEAVRAAFDAARGEDPDAEVVVERQLPGRDYRVLVVGGRVVAAAERVPAHVVGDGVTTIADLVRRVNADPRRGDGHGRALTRLPLDDTALTLLARQLYTPDSVPALGEPVWLRDNANLSTGGTSVDVTDEVHDDVAELCLRVAALVGLDIAGIDLRLPDIAKPLPPTSADEDADGGVIEVNAAPGLRMHLRPNEGRARDVAAAIVDALYPRGATGRIPTVSVTGTNGKTTTARLTAHLLADDRRRVGLTTTDGVYLDGRLLQRADATGPRSARVVLGDPTVQTAVLETARGGLLRQGLGYAFSDVAVITNIDVDHLGQDGVSTVEDLVDVKALVAERVRDGGTLVLNADDPLVLGLVDRPAVRAAHKHLVLFSLYADQPDVARHWANGGRAYVVADGALTEVTGDRWQPLLSTRELPGTFGGLAGYAVANALAAAAAARALRVPAATVAQRLRTFDPDADNPGRGSLYRLGDVHVLVDYAHNPAAIAAVTALTRRVWGAGRTVAVVTLPGDRSDDLLAQSARTIAGACDRVVLYEDTDLRGRAPGEVPRLLCDVVQAARPSAICETVSRVEEALPAALQLAHPGDVVLLTYEKMGPVLGLLHRMGATHVADRAMDAATLGLADMVDSLIRNEFASVSVARRQWDPLESTCRHASLSIL